MASIREIARLTHVSPATVSKVINGRPGVNIKTARAVRQVLERTNYQPASKAIDWNRVLVVVPNYPSIFTKGTYVSTILAGVAEQSLDMGMSLSVKKLPEHIDTVADLKQMLLQDGSSGVILIALRDGYRFADLLGVENLPHVVVGETVHQHEVNQILLDDAQSAARAIKFLIDQGHTRLGVIIGTRSEIGHMRRLNACRQTFEQMLGKKGQFYETSCPSSEIVFGRKAFLELYNQPEPPTAVLCFDHPAALGVLHEARHQNLRIPEQLSLVSYINEGTPLFLDTPLTSLQVPTYEMGRQAVCMLQNQLAAKVTRDGQAQKDREGDDKGILKRHQTTLMLQSHWELGGTTAPPTSFCPEVLVT